MKLPTAFSLLGLALSLLACNLASTTPASQPTPSSALAPTVTGSASSPDPISSAPPPVSGKVIRPTDLEYLGAFRLPGDDERPKTFAYGGNAMTFNPDGDPQGAADGFPGSLFIMGHDRMAYGELPNGNQVAEISIPAPSVSRDIETLNTAAFLQDFQDVAAGHFTDLDEIPRVGMQYLNHPKTGPKIHLAWGQHLQSPGTASHAWFNLQLAAPDLQGDWFIGDRDPYSVNGYMFEIPADWADAYVGGRYLATGRMRDGGQGGMGPSLFAYRPWLDDGTAPPSGTHLSEIPLLLYENAYNSDQLVHALNGYQHADEWEGGAWLTTASGKQAVLFAGTKAVGEKFWYGYIHPDGPENVCVDAHITDYVTCRMASGASCPAGDFSGCCDEDTGGCESLRGWWSSRFQAQFILYDPANLARVAGGQMEPWEPQPYVSLDIDEYLYFNPPEWDLQTVGWGEQRRYRIGDVTFDRANGLLYVLELYGDGPKPVVHVWRVRQ